MNRTTISDLTDNTIRKNNTSGFCGITKKENKWNVFINHNMLRYGLGDYLSFEEAVAVRVKAEELIDDFIEKNYKDINLNENKEQAKNAKTEFANLVKNGSIDKSSNKRKTLDLKGRIYGKLLVISQPKYYGKATFWNCRCTCGKEILVDQKMLLSEQISCCDSCIPPAKTVTTGIKSINDVTGLFFMEKNSTYKVTVSFKRTNYVLGNFINFDDALRAKINGQKLIDEMLHYYEEHKPIKSPPEQGSKMDLVGKKFGKLKVIKFSHYNEKNSESMWLCKCDCGNEITVRYRCLISGATKSCGCVNIATGKMSYIKNITIYDGTCIERAKAKTTPKNNTSGFRGVSPAKKAGMWKATIVFRGKYHYLGQYSKFEDAVTARLKGEEMIDDFLDNYYKNVKSFVEKEKYTIMEEFLLLNRGS